MGDDKVKKYPVFCSWCLEKGKKTVVGTSTIPNSSGICKPCMDEQITELEKENEEPAKT